MAGNIEENSKVQVTLLNYNQSNIAEFYAKNRSDSDRINIENVAAESIGFIKGKVFKSIPVGSSVLYLSEVENIEFCSLDLRPLVYRLRNYE
jgi:flavin reductase (DIM6/NTAB) family NADH-FMN oxidoreductase RutF